MRKIYALSGVSCIAIFAAVMMFASVDDGNAVVANQESASKALLQEQTFILPANDGYGISECLATQGSCGQSVAQAWCKVQGHGSATAYGVVAPEEMTATVQRASTSNKQNKFPENYYVNCKR